MKRNSVMKKMLSLMSLLLVLGLLTACQSTTNKSDTSKSSTSSSQVADKSDEEDQSSEDEDADDEDTEDDSGMDVEAIAEGDFSSIAGTWKNGKGDVMVFDDNGLDSSSPYRVKFNNPVVKDGILAGGLVPVTYSAGGAAILFAPKGTVFKDDTSGQEDKSDNVKDRIWAGQYPSYSKPEEFYYKVDDQEEATSSSSTKHKSQSVDEAVHRTDTGVKLTGGTSSSDYATQILGDKGWIVDSGSYGRTNDVPYNSVRSSSGEFVWVYQNGVIIGSDSQILYEP